MFQDYRNLIDLIALQSLQMRIEHWFLTSVLVWSALAQVAAALVLVATAFLLALLARAPMLRLVQRHRLQERNLRSLVHAAVELLFPLLALALLWSANSIALAQDWPRLVLSTGVNLLAAWIVIRLVASVIRDESWSRFVAITAFAVATLNILGLLAPILGFLDGIGMRIGAVYVSVLTILQAMAVLGVLLWVAAVMSRLLERRIRNARGLTPSMQVLMGKLLKISLLGIAFLIALRSVGIDLTAFAVFTGAVGVGVGLGLQRIVSNLISGLILLLDRSIKPGDVIEIEQTFGWVSSLGARYTSVTTRDGKEWLIPNEDLITQRVVNWSFSTERLRLLIPFGISYDSDVRLAMDLAVDAARSVPRVLKEPVPVCRLMGFGDSAVDLELRVWINDPASGVVNVKSAVLLGMWDRFHEHGVQIPFPQRDVHIKDAASLGVDLVRSSTAGPMREAQASAPSASE